MELLDYFDENLNPLGFATRDEVHREGYWHKTFHCWLIRRENTKNYILFQKRSSFKKHYPDLLDISAAGHFLHGESVQEAARELSEELGIFFRFEDLIFVEVFKESQKIGEDLNREFCYTYFLVNTQPLEAFQLQTEELSGLIELEIPQLRTLIVENTKEISSKALVWDEKEGFVLKTLSLQKKDLIPRPNTYYLEILDRAEVILEEK